MNKIVNMGYSKNDECYTNFNESIKLITYLIDNNIINTTTNIWLPFDNELSNIYKALKRSNINNLILSNLEIGLNFYQYEPKKYDIIITNPPFSNRTDLMTRLFTFKRPFIILQATQYFNNQTVVNYLSEYSNDIKLILPQSRMTFLTYDSKENIIKTKNVGIAFYSFWLCYKVKLKQTFNSLKDSGDEKKIEQYFLSGNIIEEKHLTLFTYKEKNK